MHKLIIVVLLMLVATLPLSAQDATPEETCFNKGGFMGEDGNCMLAGGVTFEINYPLDIVATHPFIEETVDNFINQERAAIFQMFEEADYTSFTGGNWTFGLDYELFVFDIHRVGVKFDAYMYTGGAHGLPYTVTYMFDLSDETAPRIMTLDDVFQEEFNPWLTIQPIVKADLMAQMGEMADEGWIDDGTGEDPTNYRSFVIDGDAIIFYFQAYQVAPYAAGLREVRIPLADINVLLKAPFLMLGS